MSAPTVLESLFHLLCLGFYFGIGPFLPLHYPAFHGALYSTRRLYFLDCLRRRYLVCLPSCLCSLPSWKIEEVVIDS